MCRGPDEDHGAVLDIWQKDILLSFVESMYLVHEKNGTRPSELVARALADFTDGSNVGNDTGCPDKVPLGSLGDDLGQGRLAASRRPKQYHVRQSVSLNDATEKFSFTEDVILSNDFVERTWTHSCGEW